MTLYVLVIVVGQSKPSETSLTKATVGTEQLSDSPITTNGLDAGIADAPDTEIDAGLDAVGKTLSLIV